MLFQIAPEHIEALALAFQFAVEHFEQRAFPTAHTPNDVNEIRFVYAEVYVVQNRTSVNKYFCVVKVYEHAEDL